MGKSTPAPGWMMAHLFLATVNKAGYGSRVRDVQVPTGFGCLPAPVLITQVSISSVPVAKAKLAPSAGPWACAVAESIGGENDGTEFR